MLSTACGVTLQFKSTHQQSAKTGSQIQAFNWVASYNDELQDYFEIDGDIEARGRAAPGGQYRRFASVTAKDFAGWRSFRDRIGTSEVWKIKTLLGPNSPFIDPSFWDQLKSTMSTREYQRKVLAMDVGPERMVYPQWSRESNLRQIPRNARNVTESMIRRRVNVPLRPILGGHDPGKLVDVTELVQLYEVPGEGLAWWVVGEVETQHSTAEQHASALAKHLQDHYRVQVRQDEERIHLRCDPYGSSDKRPEKDVYRVFKRMGFDISAAEYSKAGTGTGHIGVESRVEMLNRLFSDYEGKHRLFVACDDRRQPVAPKLVQALEQMERSDDGRAEWRKKGEGDMTHYVSALAYAIWPFEKEATKGVTTHGLG